MKAYGAENRVGRNQKQTKSTVGAKPSQRKRARQAAVSVVIRESAIVFDGYQCLRCQKEFTNEEPEIFCPPCREALETGSNASEEGNG